MRDDDLRAAITIVLLSIFGNYTGETINCRLQQKLKDNMLIKHMVLLAILYTSDIKVENIALVYLSFIMVTHMRMEATVVTFLMLGVLEFLKDDVLKARIMKVMKVFVVLCFLEYFMKQKRDKGQDFTIRKFFLGIPECSE